LYSTKHKLQLPCYNEYKFSAKRGKYIELFNLLPPLNKHLNTSAALHRKSPIVKNDIIQAMSQVIANHIKKQTGAASLVEIRKIRRSLILKSQLSSILRFVQEGKMFERFLLCQCLQNYFWSFWARREGIEKYSISRHVAGV